MSGVTKKLMSASGGAGGFTAIEDVFSTYLYTGNGSTQTITNGIDLAGEGGLVWVKSRSAARNNQLSDTERGINKSLVSNDTAAEVTQTNPSFYGLSSFNPDGFSVGAYNGFNNSGDTIASWTFRKAPRFFDVVTYTGDGTDNHTIPHNLGVAPGFIVVKRLDSAGDWPSFHRGLDATNPYQYWVELNTTSARQFDSKGLWFANPDDTNFYLSSYSNANASGSTYVAYLYAHDPLGPSGDGSDGLIACGSYTGNGSATGPIVDLGWEPQWLLVKRSNSTGDWNLIDNMRGFTAGGADAELNPNLSAAESTGTFVSPTATGFQPNTTDAGYNASGGNYIYIAIRRGPMRVPESGTEVFAIDTRDSTAPNHDSGFPVDFAILKDITGGGSFAGQRLTQGKGLTISSTDAEFTQASFDFAFMDGWVSGQTVSSNIYSWMFRRAPEFFDVVAYTGNGVAGRTVPHNLGVAPEMIIVKNRGSISNWFVYQFAIGNTAAISLNQTSGQTAPSTTYWNDTSPTDQNFSLGTFSQVNGAGRTCIAYLFATLAGVSKVGSYTGNGTSQTINCGFTTGARFIIIKRTDSTGDWYVWDTARGIVAANDPHLSLNTTAAEVTTDDSVDPDSSGFIVNQVAATNINVSAASYIFYAVA